MTDLGHAVADPHFVSRGLFAHEIVTANGAVIPTLPVPIDPGFHATPRAAPTVPPGADAGVI